MTIKMLETYETYIKNKVYDLEAKVAQELIKAGKAIEREFDKLKSEKI